MEEEILTLAGELTGTSDTELLALLCEAARQNWEQRLRSDVTPEVCGAAFRCAVAFTAAANLAESRGTDSVSSFTVGAVSVHTGGTAESKSLRQAAERLMTPYAQSEDFCFLGVRG